MKKKVCPVNGAVMSAQAAGPKMAVKEVRSQNGRMLMFFEVALLDYPCAKALVLRKKS